MKPPVRRPAWCLGFSNWHEEVDLSWQDVNQKLYSLCKAVKGHLMSSLMTRIDLCQAEIFLLCLSNKSMGNNGRLLTHAQDLKFAKYLYYLNFFSQWIITRFINCDFWGRVSGDKYLPSFTNTKNIGGFIILVRKGVNDTFQLCLTLSK